MKLKDLCSVITKGTTPTTLGFDYTSHGVNFIKIENISLDNKINHTGLMCISVQCHEKLKRSQLMPGDILFSIAGAIGRCAIVKEDVLPANTNQALSIIRLKKDTDIDKNYLLALLKSEIIISQYSKMKQGVAQLNLSLENIGDFEIPVLPLPEQQKIVAILDKVNFLINARKKQLLSLDTIIKSRFIEMFGDPVVNPKKWEVSLFGEISRVRQGLQIPISERKKEAGQNRQKYITIQYLNGNKSEEFIENPRKNVVCDFDDVLMTRTGNTGIVITGVKGVFHNNFFLIDYDKNKISKYFLINYLNTPIIQKELISRAGTATIPDLNHSEFYKISIYLPPLPLQTRFADFVQEVEKSKQRIQQSLKKLELLNNALMQKYFG